MKKQQDAKSLMKIIAGILVGAISFIVVYQFAFSLFIASVEDKLVSIASKINKTCPIIMDEFTRLDSVVVPKDSRVIKYYYTLTGLEEENMDMDAVEKEMRVILLNGIKTSPDMKGLIDNEVTFYYLYFNKNREKILEIRIDPEDIREKGVRGEKELSVASLLRS